MDIIEKIEDTLKGGFNGLFGEVVTCDIYKLKELKFTPDIVFDLGGNVGVFSRFIMSLFPDALIVAVEPDTENHTHFKKFTPDKNLILINKAIGTSEVFRVNGAVNGAHEVYLSKMTGYSQEGFNEKATFEKTGVGFITVPELVKEYLKPGMRSLIKIDIEGAENSIFEDEASMEELRKMDYVTMEIHRFALTGKEQQEVNELTERALKSFEATHDCKYEHPMFYATKK